MPRKLEGKIALITGNSGIGLATAQRFAAVVRLLAERTASRAPSPTPPSLATRAAPVERGAIRPRVYFFFSSFSTSAAIAPTVFTAAFSRSAVTPNFLDQ